MNPPRPFALEPPGPTATPYRHPTAPLWAIAEAAVLHRLAAAGGDLTAHHAVHLGDTR